MIDIKLTVDREDGEHFVVAPTMATLIAAERKFGKTAQELFSNVSLELLAWVAWRQAQRDGIRVTDFEQWLDGVMDIEAEVDDAPLGETE